MILLLSFSDIFSGPRLSALILVCLAILAFVFRRAIGRVVMHILLARLRRDEPDVYRTAREPLIAPVGLFLGFALLAAAARVIEDIPVPFDRLVCRILETAAALAAFWLLFQVAALVGILVMRKTRKDGTTVSPTAATFLASALRIVIVIVGIFVVLSIWVRNVSGLIAGLGIGGLAFALAAQDTLSNAIASLMILLDNPFDVGDWIVTPDVEGEVESIGLRSTRLRTLDQGVVSVPNNKLAQSAIVNASERDRRRVDLTLSVPWTASPEQLDRFREGLADLLEHHADVKEDSALATISDVSAEGVTFAIRYVVAPALDDMLRAKENIYLDILTLARDLGIAFSVPTICQLESSGDAPAD